MSLTLNSTLSDQYSNSYVDIAYADSYFSDHYDSVKASTWAALTTNQKTQLLVNACSVIETMRFTEDYDPHYRLYGDSGYVYDRRSGTVVNYCGRAFNIKRFFYQALQFPRFYDRDIVTGDYFIPENIMKAQCEQAVYLLSFDESVSANRMQSVQQDTMSIGNIRVSQQYLGSPSAVAPMAFEFVKPFLLKTSSRIRRA